MKKFRRKRVPILEELQLTFLLLYLSSLCTVSESSCLHPAIPFAASYRNISGGMEEDSWKISYDCDTGFEMFGEKYRECTEEEWKPEELPLGVVTLGTLLMGKTGTVHEGNKCTETLSEKSPWWTVDLLRSHSIKYIRITTRCCDDNIVIKNAEIRVGDLTTPSQNPLCNWIPKALPLGSTEMIEFEVFSSDAISISSCSGSSPSVFGDLCFDFSPGEITGYESAENACGDISPSYHLINSLTEQGIDFITSKVKRLNNVDEISNVPSLMTWMGAYRKEDGSEGWYWSTGDPIQIPESELNWGRGQPNNYNNEQNCAVLDSELNWKWNDISCRISGVAVCQGSPNKCPHPPVNKGTYLTMDSNEEGGTLTYHCGKWSGEPITCKYVDCGQVPGLLDGEIHFIDGRTSYGAHILYKCKDNYSLMHGAKESICEENGWSGRAPRCVYTKCSVPDPLTYTCHQGYRPIGSLSRECLLGGVWSGDLNPPICHYVDCEDPVRIDNGEVVLLDARTTFGAEIEYSCYEDYIFSVPSAPVGGKISGHGRTVHTEVNYSCLPGHILSGNTKASCTRKGEWSAKPPSCQFVDCGAVPQLPNGNARYINGSTHLDSIVSYDSLLNIVVKEVFLLLKKEDGTQAGRVITRRCNSDTTWTGSNPLCEFVDCGTPDVSKNGKYKLANNGTYYGSVAFYSCETHFKIEGFEKRRCEASGKWMPDAPKCVETTCNELKAPLNGSMIITHNHVGGRATFKCDYGFDVKGDNDIRCLSSGSWSSWTPNCLQIDCGKPLPVENGRVFLVNGSTTIDSFLEVHCFPRFDREGPFERKCGEDGYWNGPEPKCVKPAKKIPLLSSSILEDNVIDGATNVRSDGSSGNENDDESSNVGLIIGVVLGLIVPSSGIRSMSSLSAPAPFRSPAGASVGMNGYTGVYGGGSHQAVLPPTATVGARPPPPIQMYSMEESPDDEDDLNSPDHRGPIYDTINDDSTSGGGGSTNSGYPPNVPSTFTPSVNGYASSKNNDYDVPEGSESGAQNAIVITNLAENEK
ncbi:unnamed protein product [Lepeophtheirus salmonis]|uniref:(salmon louse) hypothetical protein n=1 Tax=Lepeophtheirus salmonis TaxID=72036 RepID=A0A7R8HC79_LEPSM|nr:unnamed protein product [Lepeophtheirus salmonis]CAF3001668.1 unnamed protein product [Lepeophtheirus salmonis]